MAKVKEGKRAAESRRSMPDREREELVSQIESEQAFRAGLGRDLPENGSLGSLKAADDLGVSPAKVDARIANMTRALKAGETPVLRGAARNAAIARHRHLAAELPETLMTRRDQDLFPKDGHDYQTAVRKAKKEIGDPAFQQKIEEYRTLGRALHPEDPDQASIERLRKNH